MPDSGATPCYTDLAGSVKAALGRQEVKSLARSLQAQTGRPGYGPRALIGVCIVKHLYCLTTWTRTTALIEEHNKLCDAIGTAPSKHAVYRFTKKLSTSLSLLNACLKKMLLSLKDRFPDMGRSVAIDSTDIPAYANGQRLKYSGGEERVFWSDPDAAWGHRSAVSTRGAGGFYGYKLHLAVCAETSIPLAWVTKPANCSDMSCVGFLLDTMIDNPVSAIMDKGYDFRETHEVCLDNGTHPIIAQKSRSGTEDYKRFYCRKKFRDIYRNRSTVESEFGRLKCHYALSELKSRGLSRVSIHVDLSILSRIAMELV